MAERTDEGGLGAAVEWHPGPPPTIAVSGELDIAVSDWFATELAAHMETMSPPVLLDLTGVTFVDSSGLSVLITAARNTDLRIWAASDAARRVIELAGLAEFLGLER